MAITALPTPPSRQDPTNFNDRADSFLGALPQFQTEANALQTNVNTSEINAVNSAAAVLAATNIVKWVSGTTYANGAVVWSPINGLGYRRITASGSGTTDPSADTTNYKQVNGTGDVSTSGDQTIAGTKTFTSTITGSVTGNAGTVTNGVYNTGNQTIAGNKTFTNRVLVSGGSASLPSIAFSDDGATDTGFYWLSDGTFGFTNNGVSSGTVTSGGNLTMVGNITAYSDERLKKDWKKLPDTFIYDLINVKYGTYTRIDTGEKQAGTSAQDWQNLLPEVVLQHEDGTLSLAYGNAALVTILKLAEKVIELETRLAKLEV